MLILVAATTINRFIFSNNRLINLGDTLDLTQLYMQLWVIA